MSKPLSGCRVLDLGIVTAGAATSALLADLGADVIKIESPSYRDPFRAWAAGDASSEPNDVTAHLFFRSNNRGKRGISLDLKHPEGREAFLRLAARSDVVLENFRRGVMERLDLGADRLRETNPELIVLAIGSQGSTGPDAGQTSYGSTLEAVGGLAWATGYAGGPPVVTGRDLNYPDQTVAMFAAGMVLAAWIGRNRGQGGASLDVSQRELTSFLLGEMFVGEVRDPPRAGNAEPQYLVQDCFLAADGAWVAVSVEGRDLAALAICLGKLAGGRDAPAVAAALRRWIAGGDAETRATRLTGAGIAAAPVLDGGSILHRKDPSWSHALVTAGDGSILKGMPFQIGAGPLQVTRDAPAVGQDTREVLEHVAGYSPAEIADLQARGVIEIGSADAQPASPVRPGLADRQADADPPAAPRSRTLRPKTLA